MPLYRNIQIESDCRLLIWKIEESLEDLLDGLHLTNQEVTKYQSFGSEARKKEFLIARVLLQKYIDSSLILESDEHGKPFLNNSGFNISITHTKMYLAILVCKNNVPALDMEHLSERVHKISKRFLSQNELKNISDKNNTLHLYQHWCAKECLIKLYGRKDVHLINELKIHCFAPTDKTFTGEVCRDDFKAKYLFQQFQFDNHLLVYSLKRIQDI